MVIALAIAMLSLRSVSGGIIAVQLASSALLCPVLPVLLVCEMSPQDTNVCLVLLVDFVLRAFCLFRPSYLAYKPVLKVSVCLTGTPSVALAPAVAVEAAWGGIALVQASYKNEHDSCQKSSHFDSVELQSVRQSSLFSVHLRHTCRVRSQSADLVMVVVGSLSQLPLTAVPVVSRLSGVPHPDEKGLGADQT